MTELSEGPDRLDFLPGPEQICIPIFAKDRESRYLFVNDALCARWGLAKAEIIGKCDHEIFTPTVADTLRANDRVVLESGRVHACEEALQVSPSGDVNTYWVVRQPLLDAAGKTTGLLGIGTDITERKRREYELVAVRNKFAATLQAMPDLLFELDLDGRYLDCHSPRHELLVAPIDELLGKTVGDMLPPEVAALCLRAMREALDQGFSTGSQFKLDLPDGSRWFELSIAPKTVEAGEIPRFIVLSRDITDRKNTEQALRESESLLRAIVDNTPVQYWARDLEGRCIMENAMVVEHWGSLLGKRPEDSGVSAADLAVWQENNRRVYAGETVSEEVQYPVHGEMRTFHNLVAPIKVDGRIVGIVGFNQDITERKHTEEQIHRLAFFDPLTRLPNRRLMFDRLESALASHARHECQGALLLVDLDNFKYLNDTRGHELGDQLLVEVARRLNECLGQGDTAARLGGDEFVVILESVGGPGGVHAETEAMAERIQRRLSAPYRLTRLPDGYPIDYQCSSSIGITLFEGEELTAEELLRRADTAMYQAKAAGRNALRFFDPEMQAAVSLRAALEADLRRAIDVGQFCLHYQIQMDHDRRPLGAEALVRWQHPERGLIAPGSFISLAEESGMIVPLGQRVLELACRQLAAWSADRATAELVLAVNVSAHQFRQPSFTGELRKLLAESGAPAHRLKLELTESLLLENSETMIERMAELKALGISFAIDDFGTGYSSLAYLKRIPLDQLKIDQSFVRDILTDPNDAAIAGTIVALGKSLGLAVIAEGVETEEQRRFLAGIGCRCYQGYLFGRPLPIAEFEAFLASVNGA